MFVDVSVFEAGVAHLTGQYSNKYAYRACICVSAQSLGADHTAEEGS